jgi:hypothetical protein
MYFFSTYTKFAGISFSIFFYRVNLDKKKSSWYQRAFNKDFPLVEKTLTLAANQFPTDFGSRHFMCIGRTRDGVDMFWQHLIAVPQGDPECLKNIYAN